MEELLKKDKSILVSLLYLDLDLYKPTKKCIELVLPRMPKGSVICIDELCYPQWPGETQAILDTLNINNYRLERVPYVPNVGIIRI